MYIYPIQNTEYQYTVHIFTYVFGGYTTVDKVLKSTTVNKRYVWM